jgi:hypothetical protein
LHHTLTHHRLEGDEEKLEADRALSQTPVELLTGLDSNAIPL